MKRIIAAAIAAVLIATSVPTAGNAAVVVSKNSAISVQESDTEKLNKGETVSVTDGNVTESVKKTGDTVKITAVKSKSKKVKLSGTVNSSKVTKISSSAFKNCKSATTIDLTDVELEELAKKQFNGAKKAKTVKINAKSLTAKKINNKAFKGFKGNKIVLYCKDKKAFNALKKKIEKQVGSNVKIVYKKAE